MSDFVFNIAKGRVAELYNRVDQDDPTNCALIVVPVDRGTATDADLRDTDTLTAALAVAGGIVERTGTWNRKTLVDSDIAAMAPTDGSDVMDLVLIAELTWTAVVIGDGAVTDLIICYDSDTTGGTDANIVPLTMHAFAITPDGSNVVTSGLVGTGFFRAS